MSVITCSICSRYVDTDFDVEGVWPKSDHGEGLDFICFSCLDDLDIQTLRSLGYDEEFNPIRTVN
jgi:hypothetical protein